MEVQVSTTETSAKMAHISAETAEVVFPGRAAIKSASEEILAAALLMPIFADAGDRRALIEYAERVKRNAEEIIFLAAE